MDNIDFAVLSKLQTLYERFGLKSYEVIAELDHTHAEPIVGMGVKFQLMYDHLKPGEDHLAKPMEARANAMLKAIGVDENNVLGGGVIAVIDALDTALTKSPRPRING